MPELILDIDDVGKRFITNKGLEIEALRSINININKNDFVCIVGPSGCGKSTLLRIVAGLEQASSGYVCYKDNKLDKPNAEIGMVFQEYSLLPWRTVLDNVLLGLELGKGNKSGWKYKAFEFLRLVGLQDFAQAYPHELSGGMRQRAAIARTLAVEPEVILMDEPFGALDAHTRILLQKELLRIWECHRKTILFVTHSVDEAIYLADKIIIMSAKPGIIKAAINIDMPRPRDRAVPTYGKLYSEILTMLE